MATLITSGRAPVVPGDEGEARLRGEEEDAREGELDGAIGEAIALLDEREPAAAGAVLRRARSR